MHNDYIARINVIQGKSSFDNTILKIEYGIDILELGLMTVNIVNK